MIILVGASATGKTEVANILRQEFSLVKVITHTTRKKREKEVHGTDYFFVTSEEFSNLLKNGAFVETTQYNNNSYGTSKEQIGDDKVLIVDPNGLKAFRDLNNPRLVSFLFQVDENTRYQRMIARGDAQELAAARISYDKDRFSLLSVGRTDYLIDSQNYTLQEIAQKIRLLYREHLKNIT